MEEAERDMREMITKQKKNLQSEANKGKIIVAESKKQGLPSIQNFYRYVVRFGRAKFLSYIYSIILWISVNIFF